MKIDNYITHLELRRKALIKKINNLQSASITHFTNSYTNPFKKRLDPNFDEINKIKNEIKEINNKLKFLLNLRKGVTNENNRLQESTKKTRR